jgi:Carboxypeptidase regulatory-like domain/TonB dependent receptor
MHRIEPEEGVLHQPGRAARGSQRSSVAEPIWRTAKPALLLAVALLGLWLCPPGEPALHGQITTADVLGTVSDSSGAVIPGATVTLLNLDTQEKRTAVSNDAGEFVFNLLKPNRYSLTVTVQKGGFQRFVIPSFALSAGDRAREDAHLIVGSEAQVVEVQAQEPALQTDSSVLGSIVTDKATQDLPLNGRNYINLVQVTPGATKGVNNGLSSGNRPDDRRQTSSISVNSQSDVINDQMIDGMDNNERVIGTIGVRPSVDAIQEVRIQSNAYTAEVGRSAGAIVDVITKAGANQFHGTAYEFLRNTALNANAYAFGAIIPKPAWHQNQFGGSFGGPIRKDKTFFFGDYEGLRIVKGLNPALTTVPTAYERNSLTTGVADFTDNPAINLKVPASQFDKVGLAYLSLYPLPTSPGLSNNFVSAPTQTQFSTTYDARVDHHFNDSNLFFARYTYNAVSTFIPGLFPTVQEAGVTISPGGNSSSYPGQAQDNAQQAQLNYVHTFTPSLVLELQAGYTLLNNGQPPLNYGVNVNQAFGQPNINISLKDSGLAPVTISGAGNNLGQTTPVHYLENNFQYNGTVTWTRGKHNIKMGGGVLRRQFTVTNIDTGKGSWTFSNFATLLSQYIPNSPFVGYSSVSRQNIITLPHYRTWEPHVFVQDDWRLRPKLTLNLGIRYDYYTPFSEVKNQLSNFDSDTGKITVANVGGVNGYAGIQPDYTNIAPRVGFAYSVNPTTVLRGGFGLSYAPENMTSGSAMVNQPFVVAFGSCTPTVCTGYGTAYQQFADGVPVPVSSSATNPTGGIEAAENPHFKSTYIEQFNLTLEKDFSGNVFSLSYVGSAGRRLAYYIPDFNALPPNTAFQTSGFNYNTLRPYYNESPGVTTIPYWTSSGSSNYNALQAVVQRRLRNNLDFQANYTFAHALDDSENISNDGSDGFASVPSRIRTLEYGNSNLDVRNRISITTNYALPFGSSFTGVKGILAKGWEMNGLYAWVTGSPFSVTNASNRSGTRPGTANSDRPNQAASFYLPNKSVHEWFNTSAFVGQAFGQVGTERRNQIYGPSFQHLDLSLFKTFPITEHLNFEFRTEAFNVANTTGFANPAASLGASGFGSLTTTAFAYTPRVIQFAGKIQF